MERPAFVYLESADHPQAEEILVKSPRLFGITAAISIVMQPLDHPTPPSLQLIDTASLSFQCSRNSRPKPVIGVAMLGVSADGYWMGSASPWVTLSPRTRSAAKQENAT
jgi:hypothetical protein